MTTREILKQAVTAKIAINSADTETKNKALANMADELLAHTDAILEANKQDVEAAKGKISDVMIDRLMLDAGRIEGMAKGIRELICLEDPAGKVIRTVERPNGIIIEKTAVPMGVIAIIYESRPNVTSDAAALCIKSGNVCVLRSGKEAWKSADAVVKALKEGMRKSGLPAEGIQLIEDTSREGSVELMKAVGYVDLLIPRGGPGLIRSCVENAKFHVSRLEQESVMFMSMPKQTLIKRWESSRMPKQAVQVFVMRKKSYSFTVQLLKSSCHYYRKS